MDKLKPSFYNFFFEVGVGEGYLAYNSRANTLLYFSAEDYTKVSSVMNDGYKQNKIISLGQEDKELLLQSGFFVPKEENELEVLKNESYIGRENIKSLTLTIAPTLACNLRCIYCFENHEASHMSKIVQEKLIEFVKHKIIHAGSLHINWFGGEPLLQPKIIKYLSEAFIKICEEKQAQYSASIITNGVLLSEEYAKILQSCMVRSVQITLDGMPEIHDKRRFDVKGKGTFEKIINNVKIAKTYLSIIIRVNIDETNREQLQKINDYFQQDTALAGIFIYPGQVQEFNEVCGDIASTCIDNQDFAKFSFEREIISYQKGYRASVNYPKRLKYACAADYTNSFVVAPSGLLFKCWNEIGGSADKAVGNLLEEVYYNKERDFYAWENWNIFQYSECIICKYLPICMGTCPYLAIRKHNLKSAICTPLKETLFDSLRLYHIDQLIKNSKTKNL
jgi:uncharacterized protein